jgi:amino acid transporter
VYQDCTDQPPLRPSVLIGYWNSEINPSAWIAVCLVVAVAINFGGTRAYGEVSIGALYVARLGTDPRARLVQMEFWFAIIKVLTIVGLIILYVAAGSPLLSSITHRCRHRGIIIDATPRFSPANPDGTHTALGFRFWHNPGPFVQYLGIQGTTGRFL